jgi:hypothetical protein
MPAAVIVLPPPEHDPTKWMPLRRKKIMRFKDERIRIDSIRIDPDLDRTAAFCNIDYRMARGSAA